MQVCLSMYNLFVAPGVKEITITKIVFPRNIASMINVVSTLLNKVCKIWTQFSNFMQVLGQMSPHKKWSYPLRTSSVNVTKSTGNFGFGHIYGRNP